MLRPRDLLWSLAPAACHAAVALPQAAPLVGCYRVQWEAPLHGPGMFELRMSNPTPSVNAGSPVLTFDTTSFEGMANAKWNARGDSVFILLGGSPWRYRITGIRDSVGFHGQAEYSSDVTNEVGAMSARRERCA